MTEKISINNEDFMIKELHENIETDTFDCGINSINFHLKNIAVEDLLKNRKGTFVVLYQNECISFITIGVTQIIENINLTEINCLTLEYLAVDKRVQNIGLGKKILEVFIMKLKSLADEYHVFRGIVLNPKTKALEEYYRKNGFYELEVSHQYNPENLAHYWIDFLKEEYPHD